MDWQRRTVWVIFLVLGLALIGSCVVSKKDYLLKVEETDSLSKQLASLKSDHDRLRGEKDALDKQAVALREERSDLEQEKSQLELKNLSLENQIALLVDDNQKLEEILRAESDTMSKNIVDLRDHVTDLKKENNLLKEKNQKVNRQINKQKDLITLLDEKNKALESQVTAIELKRQEEVLEMKGTYEHLLEDMKSEIDKGEVTITQLKGKLKVNMLDKILFDSGKTSIKLEGFEVLARVGNILSEVKDRAIRIEGHTDDVPIGAGLSKKYATNWELSAARACNVVRYLQEKVGIDPAVLSATGYGEYQAVASNESEEGRAKNRRIEFLLIPKEIAPISRK